MKKKVQLRIIVTAILTLEDVRTYLAIFVSPGGETESIGKVYTPELAQSQQELYD